MKDRTLKNYIAVGDWMLQLKLTSKELLAYALIYGFSQDGESCFRGSLTYIGKWLGVLDKSNVSRTLSSLIKKGLITKENKSTATKNWNEYQAVSNNYKTENYILIYPWMVDELGLSDKELLIYAMIYGYSFASDDSLFVGNNTYLGKWLNVGSNHIGERYIKPLLAKNLIVKVEDDKRIGYRTTQQNNNASGNPGNNGMDSQNDNPIPTFDNGLSQNDNQSSQFDNLYSPKMTTNNINNNILNNINIDSESVSTDNILSSDDEDVENDNVYPFECDKSEDEILSSLTKSQLSALNKLIIMAERNQIESSKESLINYFGLLQARGWKDSRGQKIKNIIGYVQSTFSIHTKQKTLATSLLEEQGYI